MEVGAPALLMGFSFPLANAVIQRTERSVGTHAGALYLANTVGAVCGSSLAAGFLLLPSLGFRRVGRCWRVAGLAWIPLYLGPGGLRIRRASAFWSRRCLAARGRISARGMDAAAG